jgi:hypothetical protein
MKLENHRTFARPRRRDGKPEVTGVKSWRTTHSPDPPAGYKPGNPWM